MDIIKHLMEVSASSRYWHWLLPNFNYHKIVEQFYTELDPLIDELAELTIKGKIPNKLYLAVHVHSGQDILETLEELNSKVHIYLSEKEVDLDHDLVEDICIRIRLLIRKIQYLVSLAQKNNS